jgi:hypothetical protein
MFKAMGETANKARANKKPDIRMMMMCCYRNTNRKLKKNCINEIWTENEYGQNYDIKISQSLDTHQNRSYRQNSFRDGRTYLFGKLNKFRRQDQQTEKQYVKVKLSL